MRRIRFSIYSDSAKERDDCRLKRCSEAIKKARKNAGIGTTFRREDYYKRWLKEIRGGANE
jgi:hypothetical protein